MFIFTWVEFTSFIFSIKTAFSRMSFRTKENITRKLFTDCVHMEIPACFIIFTLPKFVVFADILSSHLSENLFWLFQKTKNDLDCLKEK